MKKITKAVVLLFTVSLSLTSCSNDDDGPSTSGNLVGKWEFSKVGERIDGKEELEVYEHSAGCSKDNIVFNADNTLVGTTYDDDGACTVYTTSGIYAKSGNNLMTSFNGDDSTVTIKQLDGTTLKVYETYTDTEDGETYTDITVLKRAN